jgi:hypothetical protein
MTKVAVITPTKNRRALLSEAIASVPRRRFPSGIVNDGSGDGTQEMVCQLAAGAVVTSDVPERSIVGSVMSNDATVVLTFPSPQYQRYLRAENPRDLQIIDEVIELADLLALANDTGFTLRHFSLEDVWFKNQYVHCPSEVGRIATATDSQGAFDR